MKKILLITTMVVLLLSCEHDTPMVKNYDKQFYGKWELVRISGGFSQPEIFNAGQIIWEFSSDKSLSIKINTPLSKTSGVPFNKSTTLTFSADSAKILIDQIPYAYRITDKKLKLMHQLASDGNMLEFEKR